MSKSKIEWTDRVWNPTVGCARVSPGCEHCYAETQAARVVLMQQAQGRESVYLPVVDVERRRWNRTCVTVPERLEDPLRWKKPARVFVNSMSDLFHDDVPFEFIAAVFGVMAATPQHTYQILTKRPQRMREFFEWLDARVAEIGKGDQAVACIAAALVAGGSKRYEAEMALFGITAGITSHHGRNDWPLPNVWLGVSVEDQARADERIPVLLECPAALRFLSCEPLLGEVDLMATPVPAGICGEGADYYNALGGFGYFRNGEPAGGTDGERIDWVIVGGESGPGARECDLDEVLSVVGQCKAAGVPCFVKQLGAKPTIAGRRVTSIHDRKGADPSEWPADLRVQEMPK